MKMSGSSNRDMDSLQVWANGNGILLENGFTLLQNDDNDWSVTLSKSATEGTRLIQIPKDMLWSSKRIRNEEPFNKNEILKDSLEYLRRNEGQFQIPQFYIGLKLLYEHEKQTESLWHPWIQSLPSMDQFNTAVSMTDLELDCLPPFAWSLAKLQKTHMKDLIKAVQMIPPNDDENRIPILTKSTLQNTDLVQWAFTVVFTRCWGPEEEEKDDEDDTGEDRPVDMVPLGDMFNHGYPANVLIHYDDKHNCNVILKYDVDVTAHSDVVPLSLSYGQSTNPSRFLSTYGFVDTQQTNIFSQILVEKPSKLHVDMGYDNAKMTVSTADGSISEENWDVVLYSILEQVPELQKAFHHAHTTGNMDRKRSIQNQFALETAIMMKRHFDRTVQDLTALIEKIDDIVQNGGEDGEHPRLPMIRLHNAFIRDTFIKAQGQLKMFLMEETARRKQN